MWQGEESPEMVTQTFLCNQKEDIGQEPSAQNENPVTAFFFFFCLNSLLDKFSVIDQVETWDACLV